MDAFPKVSFPFFSIDACSYFFFNSLYLNTKHKEIIRKLVMTENLYLLMVKSGRWWELSEASGCGFDGDDSMAFLFWVLRRFRSDPLLFRVVMIMNSEEFLSLHSYLRRRTVILKVCFFFFCWCGWWWSFRASDSFGYDVNDDFLWSSTLSRGAAFSFCFCDLRWWWRSGGSSEEPYETLILSFNGPGRFYDAVANLTPLFRRYWCWVWQDLV